MARYTMGVAAAALMLGSCGGGDSGGGSIPVVPAPSPTPAPTASPSPTPTPSPTYEMAYDLSRDRSFALNTAQLMAVGTSGQAGFTYSSIASTLINPAQNPLLNYASATQEASIVISNGAPRVYPQSQISLRASDRLTYSAPDGFLSISQPGPTIGGFASGLRYVVLAAQSSSTRNAAGNLDIIERRSVAGTSTITSDVPRTGTATYRVLLTSMSYSPSEANGFLAQDATLTVDYAAGMVRGTIIAASTVSNQPARSITFTISGQLSGTSNRLVGSITGMDGSTGQFAGELYGSAGVELGLAFSFQGGSEQIAGTVVGVRR